MIVYRFIKQSVYRVVDLNDLFFNQTAMLVGGSPTLKEEPLELLSERGVVSMAINNAAIHFKPTFWCGVDRPECFEPQILLDPTIIKFGNISHANIKLDNKYSNKYYWQMPNMFFFSPKENISWGEFFDQHAELPWRQNTFFASIYILYRLGVRRIILAGSDFSVDNQGKMYAHESNLDDLQKKWNSGLYNTLVFDMCSLKPLFDSVGLTVLDCSRNSRISAVYKKISFTDAIKLCKEGFPENPQDPKSLPHCSKFASESLRKAIQSKTDYIVYNIPNDILEQN